MQPTRLEQVKTQTQAELKLAEIASRERVAAMQTQAQLIKTEAEINASLAQTKLQETLAYVRQIAEQGHDVSLRGVELAHERAEGEAQRVYDADQAERDREYEYAAPTGETEGE